MKKFTALLTAVALPICAVSCGEKPGRVDAPEPVEASEADMLSFKSAEIRMADDFSQIMCMDKSAGNQLIFGELKSGGYGIYIANSDFTEEKILDFSPQDGERLVTAALMRFGRSAVLSTIGDTTMLHTFDENGSIENSLDLGEVISSENRFVQLLCSEDGFYINIDRESLVFADSKGNLRGEVGTKGQNICGIVCDSGGIPCALLSNGGKMTLAELSEGKISAEIDCGELSDYTNAISRGEGDYRIAVVTSTGLYGLKDDKWAKLSDFSDNDFYIHDILDMKMVRADEFAVLIRTNGGGCEMRLLTQRDISEVIAKQVVRLAYTTGGNVDPYDALIKKYNSESEKYKIEIVNYEGSTSNEKVDAMKRDIVSGKAPDIVSFHGLEPEELGAANGTFVDLYTLLDSDSDISRSDFLDGFLENLESDGKLYQLSPTFFLSSVMIKDKFANGLTSWDINHLEDICRSRLDDMDFCIDSPCASMDEMFGSLFKFPRYYDKNAAECNFTSPDFIREMKFIKENGIGIPSDQVGYGSTYSGDDEITSFRDDKVLVQFAYMSGFAFLRRYLQVYSNEPATFIGFPNSNSETAAASASGNTYGIMADSQNIEGAWDFLKYYFFSEDAYKDGIGTGYYWNFAGCEKYYKRQLEFVSTPHTYTDPETGEEKNSDIFAYYPPNSEQPVLVELQPFTKEESEKYDKFVRSALSIRGSGDSRVNQIVSEESAAYFAGERSAEDAARIIQNRVTIYLSERA